MGLTREQAKELLPIIQAFADGKKIETRYDIYDWTETQVLYLESNNEYRIKPEPKYRPFKTQEECWNEMHKHPDFGWIVAKNKKELVQIGRILVSRLDNVMITLSIDEGHNFNSSYYFNHYRFTDGEPFGIKEQY